MKNKPEYAWNLTDLASIEKKNINVMSTFACGGGSSMGYKLAGCDIVAANDIDPEMQWHYKENLKPDLYYLCPINDLLTKDLPAKLYELDMLDGSPPCSTFSIAGSREKAWGKEKHFREGQAKQVLSDLFFDYLDLVEKLKPKVAIAENVKGMIVGNAKGYAKLIIQRFKEIGYRPQLFLVNAADCGVPQRRERVFFCALRNDIEKEPLQLGFKHRWITAGEATQDIQELTQDEIYETRPRRSDRLYWYSTKAGNSYKHAVKNIKGKESLFQHFKLDGKNPSTTLTANNHIFTHWSQCRKLTFREWKRLGSFPDDYKAKNEKIGKYIIGMSVPPLMAKAIASSVIDQWLT